MIELPERFTQAAKQLPLLESLSCCLRRHVGCVILDQSGYVLGRGYNGDMWTPKRGSCKNIPRDCGCNHAETSAINAVIHTTNTDHHTAQYGPLIALVTCTPCMACYNLLRSEHIAQVYWHEPSDPGVAAIEAMQREMIPHGMYDGSLYPRG